MGKVKGLIEKHIANGAKIAATTYCDHLIVSDTCNFGAYALVGAILIELINLYKTEKTKFLERFPMLLQVLLESIQSTTDLI
jgi:hypothetical protein